MKKFAFGVIVVLALGAAYLAGRLQAREVIEVPPASWAEASPAASAWRQLVVSLEAAAAKVFAASDNPQDRLDGLQLLADLLSASLEMKLSKNSPAEPQFTNWMADYRKFLGDSPDAIYHTAEISSAYRYEVSGNIGEADYLGFMLYGIGLNGWNRAVANLANDALVIDDNGDFRIVLSQSRPQGEADWLGLEDDVHMLMVRQYFHDRPNSTPATLRIRNLDLVESHKRSDEHMAAALQQVSGFINATLDGAIALSDMISAEPNSAEPPKAYNQDFAGVFYPTFDNQYLGTWFQVAEDEALVIEGDVPKAAYWSASVQNRWLQSLDYQHHPVSLNNSAITTENGRYRIILAHRQPEGENWLSTAGYTEGLLAIRYQQPQSQTKAPTLTLVKWAELAKE